MRDRLATEWRVAEVSDWCKAVNAEEPYSLTLAVDPDREGGGWRSRLRAWIGRRPGRPLVAVLGQSTPPRGVHPLRGVIRLLGWSAGPLDLALAETRAGGYLERLALGLEANRSVRSPLRHVLAHACRRSAPVPTVEELATLAGRSPRTLHYHWRCSEWGRDPPPGLREFLDWILLLRSTVHRLGTSSWARTSLRLGLSMRTLRRVVRRLVGCTPCEVSVEKVAEKFDRRFPSLGRPEG